MSRDSDAGPRNVFLRRRFRVARVRAGFATATSLATTIGASAKTVSTWEADPRANPSGELLVAACAAMNERLNRKGLRPVHPAEFWRRA